MDLRAESQAIPGITSCLIQPPSRVQKQTLLGEIKEGGLERSDSEKLKDENVKDEIISSLGIYGYVFMV